MADTTKDKNIKNVLITTLSLIRSNQITYYQLQPEDEEITGIMTNEAPTKLLAKSCGGMHHIITINSSEIEGSVTESLMNKGRRTTPGSAPVKEGLSEGDWLNEIHEITNQMDEISRKKGSLEEKISWERKRLFLRRERLRTLRNIKSSLAKETKAYSLSLDAKLKERTKIKNEKAVAVMTIPTKPSWKHFDCQTGNEKVLAAETELTHYDYYRNSVNDFFDEQGILIPEYHRVAIKNEPDYREVVDAAVEVRQQLEAIAEDADELRIYMEANGGIRFILTMLVSLITTFEKTNPKVTLVGIYNTVAIMKDNALVKNHMLVKNQLMVYRSGELLAVVDEFVNYGRTNALNKYVNQLLEQETDKMVESVIRECLSRLQKTSEDLQLCRAGMVVEDLYGTGSKKGLLQYIDGLICEYRNTDNSNMKVFLHVLGIIRSEYRVLEQEEGEAEAFQLVRVIQWCVDKGFIQQAVTLCAERLPRVLYDTGVVCVSDELRSCAEENGDKNYDVYYSILTQLCEYAKGTRNGSVWLKEKFYKRIQKERFRPILMKLLDDIEEDSIVKKEVIEEFNRPKKERNYNEVESCNDEYEKIKQDFLYLLKDLAVSGNTGYQSICDGTVKERLKNVQFYCAKLNTKVSFVDLKKLESGNRSQGLLTIQQIRKIAFYCRAYMVFDEFPATRLRSTDFESLLLRFQISNTKSSEIYDWIESKILCKDFSGAIDSVNIRSNRDNVGYIIALYSIIKIQRHLTNHADEKPSENRIPDKLPLDTNEISVVITELLDKLKESPRTDER